MKESEKSLIENRIALRKKILALRDLIIPTERKKKSRAILKQLHNIDRYQQASNLFVYINYRSEVETIPIVEDCMNRKQRVTVPLTIPGKGLLAYELNNITEDLAPGFCSIPEPVKEKTFLTDPSFIEIVILPGSVFDIQGGRLGYGGGYYDRFLVNDAPQALRIGIAFEQQVVDQVPLMDHDQLLDYLVTEKRIYKR